MLFLSNVRQPNYIPKIRRNDAKKVFLFTNARDEPNIAEWVAHHLLLGFDHIFIFDHKSKIPIKQIGTFDNRLTIFRVGGEGNIKTGLMTTALNISRRQKASWMLYLDADEFLQLNAFPNVKMMLQHFHYADSLGINWLMFGSSYHITQPKGLLMEHFIKSSKLLDQHVKTFVRPEQVLYPLTPHNYKIDNPIRNIAVTGNLIKPDSPFNRKPILFTHAPAYIAHYIVQSEQEFMRRKGRQMDDGTGNKTGLYKNIHENHNEVENRQLHNKYTERVKKMLRKYNIRLAPGPSQQV
jgi:hypothetical protein